MRSNVMSTHSSSDNATPALVDDFDLEPDASGGDAASATDQTGSLHSVIRSSQRRALRDLLVLPMLERALGRDLVRQLKLGVSTLALVVTAPSPAWVTPLRGTLIQLAFPGFRIIKPSERLNRPDEATRRAEEVAEALSDGVSVAGIAADPERELSRVLLAAADAVVTVPAPDAALVNRAIRAFSRKRKTSTLTARDLAGLDFADYAAAFRPGSTSEAIATRLTRAAAGRSSVSFADDAPPLAALTGYGPARAWAEDLVQEVEAMRAGQAPAAAIESCLLFGIPGTGKTTLARSLARELKLPLITTSVAAWFAASDGHLGAVLKEQASFFAALRAHRSGCIGFIDEFDSLPSRDGLSGSRNVDFWAPVITGMLLAIDTLRQTCPDVILMAATNHVDRVDPALRRPGRFDRVFEIAPPDAAGLAGILRTHLKDDLADADLAPVAQLLLGRVGADAVQVVQAARKRARLDRRPLTLDDLLAEASPPEPRSLAELRACAIHEAGHAVVAVILGRTLKGVSLQLAGATGGMTRVKRSGFIPTRDVIEDDVVIRLAGRAAESALGDGASAGAMSDLETATNELSALHASYGLGTTLLHRAGVEEARTLVRLDPRFAQSIEADLQRLMGRAIALVTVHRSAVRAVAEALLARQALSGAEVQVLVAAHPPAVAAKDRPDDEPGGLTLPG
jgi:hypothetical protein